MRFERPDRTASPMRLARSLRKRMTRGEARLWAALRDLNANFRRQAPIGRFIVDFAALGPGIVVEVDGGVHQRLEEVMLRDVERQAWLESQGFRVVRFTNRQVDEDLDGCVSKVKALLLDGGGLGGGVATALKAGRGSASAPNDARRPSALRTPPSPALPPSRRKEA